MTDMTNEELADAIEQDAHALAADIALADRYDITIHSGEDRIMEAARRLRAMSWRPIAEGQTPDGPHFRGLHVQRRGRDGSVLYTYWDAFYGYVEDETGEFVTVDGGDCGWSVGDFTHWYAAPQPPEPTDD